MHFTFVSGSHRKISQSARIAHFLAARAEALIEGATTDVIELAGNPLPLWDEGAWESGSDLLKLWKPYADRLAKADALVFMAAEWHGMVPAGLKNFLLFCSAKEVGHKPALIVTVSSSRGGAYPVDEMRISGYKNARICYIPEHLIVRDAEKMFVGEAPQGEEDAYLRGRADYTLGVLGAYAKALKPMREAGGLMHKNYPFGM